MVRRRFKLLARLALIAMLGLALGPTVSRALHAARAADAPVHEAAEPHHHHDASGLHGSAHHTSQPAGGAHDPLDHCGLCAVAGSPCSPSAPPHLPAADVACSRVPATRILSRGRPRPRWSRARPRGPPVAARHHPLPTP
jgi:Protein of unknown function (DUF2946)